MGSPLRILHTEASVGWGGQEIRILTEARGMIARGHEVSLACPPEATIHREAPRFGVAVVSVPLLRVNTRAVLAMRRWLADHPCDVVNTHSSVDSWVVALASRLRLRSPPVVRTRHISARLNRSPGTLWLYRRASRRVVTTGTRLREQLIESHGLDPARIVSIPTGVDAARFVPGSRRDARRSLGLPEDAFIAGIVATLRSWKGHRFLLDAWARIPDETARLVIVGGGPQDGPIRERISELGLKDRVVMAGNQDDVVPWLRALDVFALPSYANEGVPQAVIQAQMCELPVIATAEGGIPEAVQDGVTGLVVPHQDSEALAAALTSLMRDPDRRRGLGTAARREAIRKFDLGVMLDAMERVFREAIDDR